MNRKAIRELVLALMGVVKEVQIMKDRTLDPISVEIFQLALKQPQIRPSDLAKELNFNPSSVTRRIQSLKNAGFVQVKTDPADQRSSLISLTKAGELELQRLDESFVHDFEKVLSNWSEENMEQLKSLLFLLSKGLQSHRESDSVEETTK
ncbi:MarR family winged helix-turn-helix transcriptional regulator [Paenibacillus ehimensis]|uniref:MarR family winged helix-turn-helix transcriptional regulator n=1 Tax=Paenibacillus ehimensis TaxID=79264 RepID=UPI000FD7694C|nr:MarR family transcriptional regulator [Paenibacillus ehimensis]